MFNALDETNIIISETKQPLTISLPLWQKKSLPILIFFLDTFASKTAAIQDETADASVGNVTGSNAVNVFLGNYIMKIIIKQLSR